MIACFICFWLSSVEKRDDCSLYLFLFWLSSVEKRDDCSFYLFLFLLSSEKKFRTTQELEYLFFCLVKCEIVFQNVTLG
jgi:hypothetical protein